MHTLFKQKHNRFQIFFIPMLSLSIFLFLMGFLRLKNTDSREVALRVIPYMILYSCVLVILFSQDLFNIKSIVIGLLIAFSGYLIEVLGVKSGIIFGHYSYGQSLGFKFMNTPLIIGLNWFFLVYASAALVEYFNIPVWLKIITASLGMVIFDFFLEKLASIMDLWYWHNSRVPLQNYIGWFILAFVFHSVLRFSSVKLRNPMAVALLVIQFILFLALFLFI
jgi:uncharacterized membrane protein